MSRGPLVASRRLQAQLGFSLIEITLAIGIIAFAFVALFGLLPVGLQTFRTAIDTSNETRIVQSYVARVLATNFETVKSKMDFGTSREIVYFDEEGTQLDTSIHPIVEKEIDRIYAAKLFVRKPVVPTQTGTYDFAQNVVIVFANIRSPAAKEFSDNTETLERLQEHLVDTKGKTDLKIRPIMVSKMDGLKSN